MDPSGESAGFWVLAEESSAGQAMLGSWVHMTQLENCPVCKTQSLVL